MIQKQHPLEIENPERYRRKIAWDGESCNYCMSGYKLMAVGRSEAGGVVHIHDMNSESAEPRN